MLWPVFSPSLSYIYRYFEWRLKTGQSIYRSYRTSLSIRLALHRLTVTKSIPLVLLPAEAGETTRKSSNATPYEASSQRTTTTTTKLPDSVLLQASYTKGRSHSLQRTTAAATALQEEWVSGLIESIGRTKILTHQPYIHRTSATTTTRPTDWIDWNKGKSEPIEIELKEVQDPVRSRHPYGRIFPSYYQEEPAYDRIDSASIATPAHSISPRQQILLAITLLYWHYLAPTVSFYRTIVH